MMRRRDVIKLIGAATVAWPLAPGRAAAQAYPNRPVMLVVPFPPGGGNDALARAAADGMSKTLGQQVVVDNRGGAGGTVATRAVAKNAPDGYTILLAYTGTLAINPTLYPNPGYDPRKDFAPIGLIGSLSSVLVVNPSLPVRSVAELIAFAKANPARSTMPSRPARSDTSRPRRSPRRRASSSRAFPTRATAPPWPTCSAATSR
jgi:tripartite-type tricarboxylate transporter receptor subunit TctC